MSDINAVNVPEVEGVPYRISLAEFYTAHRMVIFSNWANLCMFGVVVLMWLTYVVATVLHLRNGDPLSASGIPSLGFFTALPIVAVWFTRWKIRTYYQTTEWLQTEIRIALGDERFTCVHPHGSQATRYADIARVMQNDRVCVLKQRGPQFHIITKDTPELVALVEHLTERVAAQR